MLGSVRSFHPQQNFGRVAFKICFKEQVHVEAGDCWEV